MSQPRAEPQRAAPPATSDARAPLKALLPLVVFLVLAAVFAIGLRLDPREIPSVLVGREVPHFALPPVQGRQAGLSDADLHGQVSLLNVFASWCTECRVEHPFLLGLAQRGEVPVYGLNYKDKPADAQAWLDQLGDPYSRTGADLDGRVAIDFGVYGVPETFVIDASGRIAAKHIGPLTEQAYRETIAPLIRRLAAQGR